WRRRLWPRSHPCWRRDIPRREISPRQRRGLRRACQIRFQIKPKVVGNDEELRRNSGTMNELVVRGERNLDAERVRLCSLIDRFVSGGPSVCTTHPHPFLGPLTPGEWAVLMYKHLDHHLRQFGV